MVLGSSSRGICSYAITEPSQLSQYRSWPRNDVFCGIVTRSDASEGAVWAGGDTNFISTVVTVVLSIVETERGRTTETAEFRMNDTSVLSTVKADNAGE